MWEYIGLVRITVTELDMWRTLVFVLFAGLLAACAGEATPTPTVVATPIPTATPTSTPIPMPTPTPTSTATATPTPTAEFLLEQTLDEITTNLVNLRRLQPVVEFDRNWRSGRTY